MRVVFKSCLWTCSHLPIQAVLRILELLVINRVRMLASCEGYLIPRQCILLGCSLCIFASFKTIRHLLRSRDSRQFPNHRRLFMRRETGSLHFLPLNP
ncbi:hypothetical protein BDV59DRAFT_106480 [Aspergillus ambiguus]|uniref:uncharacterized protein n=1 Tax=Aspergillus ambiguus TaxID=176160 RepID=UPI003CCD4FB3